MKTEADGELIRRALDGDQDAYTDLYRGSRKRVSAIVSKVLRSYPDDVEDVVQESMMRAFASLGCFTGGSTFNTWVHRIAFNTSCEKLRRHKTSTLSKAGPLEYESESGETLQFDIETENTGYRDFEVDSDLQKVTNRLSAKVLTVLKLKYIEGLSSRDAADVLGITLPAFKSRAFHGIRKARGIMEEVQKPIEKQRCVECAKADRFRFADVLEDGNPLCKWCQKESKVEPKSAHDKGSRTWTKKCRCCGEEFTTAASAQVYAPGHHGKPEAKKDPEPTPQPKVEIQRVEAPVDQEMVMVRVPVKSIDQMWEGLSIADKVRVFEFLMK